MKGSILSPAKFCILHSAFCISIAAFCISFSSCKEDKEVGKEAAVVRVTGVSLDRPAVTLNPDSTVQLTATVAP